MDFANPAQEKVHEKVGRWLKEIAGDKVVSIGEKPIYLVPHGSTMVECRVAPFGERDCCICNRSYVISGARLDESLYKFLLNENAKLIFGAFGVDEEGDIVFHHSIYGDTCDKEDLLASVAVVVAMADQYDDQVKARWGGKTIRDRVMEGL